MKTFALILITSFSFINGYSQEMKIDYDAAGNRIKKYPGVVQVIPANQNISESGSRKASKPDSLNEKHPYSILIYPNPTKESIQIIVNNYPKDSICTFEISDNIGNVFCKKDMSAFNQHDLTQKPIGTYYVKVSVGKNLTYWKIIKE